MSPELERVLADLRTQRTRLRAVRAVQEPPMTKDHAGIVEQLLRMATAQRCTCNCMPHMRDCRIAVVQIAAATIESIPALLSQVKAEAWKEAAKVVREYRHFAFDGAIVDAVHKARDKIADGIEALSATRKGSGGPMRGVAGGNTRPSSGSRLAPTGEKR